MKKKKITSKDPLVNLQNTLDETNETLEFVRDQRDRAEEKLRYYQARMKILEKLVANYMRQDEIEDYLPF